MQTTDLSEERESTSPLPTNLQLVKYLPEQIGEAWPLLKAAIASSYPKHLPLDERAMTSIMVALMTGMLEAWMLVEVDNSNCTPKATIHGIATLYFGKDTIANEGVVTIYTITAYKYISPKIWRGIITILGDYARKMGCRRMVAVTDNPAVIRLIKRLGGNTEQRFVRLSLTGEKESEHGQ